MIFSVDKDKQNLRAVEKQDFKELDILERQHIEEWVIEQPQILGEELLIISSEFNGYDKLNERLDVLALDPSGSVVVVELKRDKADKTTDLQALKYASYIANFSATDIQELYRDFWNSRKEESIQPEKVGEIFQEFLSEADETITIGDEGYAEFELDNKPRIILAAGDFGKEITSPAYWLIEQYGLKIRCVELQGYEVDGKLFVNTRVVLPVPETEEYVAKRREKQEEQESQKRGRAIHVLLNDILAEGDIVVFNKEQTRFDINTESENADIFKAKVTGKTGQSNNIRWLYDGEEYSFTALTKAVVKELTGEEPNSVNGYNYWKPEGHSQTLSELRNNKDN